MQMLQNIHYLFKMAARPDGFLGGNDDLNACYSGRERGEELRKSVPREHHLRSVLQILVTADRNIHLLNDEISRIALDSLISFPDNLISTEPSDSSVP
jgi:hypothetical protein